MTAFVATALAGVLPGFSAASRAETDNPFTTSASRAADVHFVPLDARAKQLLAATVPGVTHWLHHSYEITDVPSPKPNWVDPQRNQLNGRAVMADLLSRYQRVRGVQPGFLIPVSSASMYDSAFPDLRFVFGARGLVGPAVSGGQAMAIVATAQMRVYHPDRENARLSKMMLRYIGEVICRLPRNGNPNSVMYTPLLSDADLDRMATTLPSRC